MTNNPNNSEIGIVSKELQNLLTPSGFFSTVFHAIFTAEENLLTHFLRTNFICMQGGESFVSFTTTYL